MSDKNYELSTFVKLGRTCLTMMTCFVILCQTLSNIVIAGDIVLTQGVSGEVIIGDNIRGDIDSLSGGSPDIVSDTRSGLDPQDSSSHPETQSINHISSGSTSQYMSDTGTGTSQGGLSTMDEGGSAGLTGNLQEYLSPGSDTQTIDSSDIIVQTASTSEPLAVQTQVDSSVAPTSFAMTNPSPQLSITEVRIDGTDEYIEITNRGDPFIGTISISGVKGSLLTISLDLGINESAVIGDILAMIVVSGFDILSSQGLSMTDSSAVNLALIHSGQVIDTLVLTSLQVLGSDNQSASREYDFESKIWQITPIQHNLNIIAPHRGNPGAVWGLTLLSSSTGSSSTGTTTTGTILTGEIATGTMISGAINTGVISVFQVYPFSDCLGEHLALSFSTPYSGNLTIQGLGTSDTSKTFYVDMLSSGTLYIVESVSNLLSDNVVVVPSITLTDGGEALTLLDSSGQIMDSIIYSNTSAGKASSFSSNSGAVRLFSTNQAPSLPSSCTQSQQTAQVGGCRISAQVPSYATGTFSTSFTASGESLVSSTCAQGQRSVDGVVTMSDSCVLSQSFTAGSHRISYQQYSGSVLVCEDEYMFHGVIHSETPIITNSLCTNTSSSNSPVYYEALYRKRKDRHSKLSNAVEYVGLTVTVNDDVYGTCDQVLLSGDRLALIFDPAKEIFRIHTRPGDKLVLTSIIADGTGNDREGTELIEFFNKSKQPFDLEGLSIIVNNKIVEHLSGTIGINSFITLTDYFPLPNSAGCVAIYGDGQVYDEVCYGKYTEKHTIDLEYLKAPKTKTKSKTGSTSANIIDMSDSKFIKQCLKIEEYQLLQLDIREQKLINKAQKTNYQVKMSEWRDMHREKNDELYIKYRSITDKKQAYIESQQQYIDKLRGQISQCSTYSTRITQLYNSNKIYTQTLKDTSSDYYKLQSTIKQDYPAIYQDIQGGDDSLIDTGSQSANSSSDQSSRRTTVKYTISNLFS